MFNFRRFGLIVIFLSLLLLFQSSSFFSLGGVRPDLILIFFTYLAFSGEAFYPFLTVIAIFLCLVFLAQPFWILPNLVISAIGAAFIFVRRRMTGNKIMDFLVSLGIGTVVFYTVLYFLNGRFFSVGLIGLEVIYNLVLGVLAWYCLKRIFHNLGSPKGRKLL